MNIEETILQIIPAPGWRGKFTGEIWDPVVCFALVEVKGYSGDVYREVRPMVADGKEVMFATEASNFIGLDGPNAVTPPA